MILKHTYTHQNDTSTAPQRHLNDTRTTPQWHLNDTSTTPQRKCFGKLRNAYEVEFRI